jgi:hypothetical protein
MHVLAHVWQQRCLEVASRLHHVGIVDETRRTYRHHGRQRDAPRRIATLHHATRRCASHHIATQRLSRSGSPAARARLARSPLKRLWLRENHMKRNTCERRRKFISQLSSPEGQPASRREVPDESGVGQTPDGWRVSSTRRTCARQ